MACPDAILWVSRRPFMGARSQVDACPDGSNARPDGVCHAWGWRFISRASGQLVMPVLTGSVLMRAKCLSSRHFWKSLLPLLHFYGFSIQNPGSMKIQPSKLKSVFGNVILALGSTFLSIGLRYFHKILSLEILG